MLTWEALNIAHGGGVIERRPHTLLAYHHALDVGADVLGVDLRRTSDGAIVAMSGVTVDGTTNGTGAVADMILAQVQALDAAYRFGPAEGFPTAGWA